MSAGTSSVLPNNTYANPIQELWTPAGGGGGGGSAGVMQIVAGTNVTISPPSGEGVVTINASGGSAPAVTSIVAGTGLTASAPTGDVTLTNTGVTSLVAGSNVILSGATGAVTVSVPNSTPTSSGFFGAYFPTQGPGGSPCLALSYTKIGTIATIVGQINVAGGAGNATVSLPPATVSALPAPDITAGSRGLVDTGSFVISSQYGDGTAPIYVSGQPFGPFGQFQVSWSAGRAGGNSFFYTFTYKATA